MSEPAVIKPKGKKLDSIISKLRSTKPSEVVDSEDESAKPIEDNVKEHADSGGEGVDSGGELNVVKKSKRKSGRAIHYRRQVIDLEDDENEGNATIPEEIPQTEEPTHGIDLPYVEEPMGDEGELMPSGNIADLLENGPELLEEDDTTVLIVPAESIKVQAVAVGEDEFQDLSDLDEHEEESERKKKKKKKHKQKREHDSDSSEEEEKSEGEERKKKKKKEKKKRIPDSDISMDEDGLPKRITCTACGRHVNPSHGKVLRHPLLNVLVCKKCNQYYNSGPFTRDEYGIEEQCRWCGDGGALICCDKCEKAFCQPCIKRNCGKQYLKKLMSAPDDYKWNCFACTHDAPIIDIKKRQKRCNYVMDILDGLKSRKAPFKSKKGLPVSGPTTSERRSRLNSLSEGMGIKIEGLSTPEKSPTKKTFSKEIEPPPTLFEDANKETGTGEEASEKADGSNEKSGDEKALKEGDKNASKEVTSGELAKHRPSRDSGDSNESLRRSTRNKSTEKEGKEAEADAANDDDEDNGGVNEDEPFSSVLERVSKMSKNDIHEAPKEKEQENVDEKDSSHDERPRRSLRSKEVRGLKSDGSSSEAQKSKKEPKGKGKKSGKDSKEEDKSKLKGEGSVKGKNKSKSREAKKSSEEEEDEETQTRSRRQNKEFNAKVKEERRSTSVDGTSSDELPLRRTTRVTAENIKKERSSSDESKAKGESSKGAQNKVKEKKKEVVVIDVDSSSEEGSKRTTRKHLKGKHNKEVKKEQLSESDELSESSDSETQKKKRGKREQKKRRQAKSDSDDSSESEPRKRKTHKKDQKKKRKHKAKSESEDSDSSTDENRISALKVRFTGKALRPLRTRNTDSNDSSISRGKNKKGNKISIKKEKKLAEDSSESDGDFVSKRKGAGRNKSSKKSNRVSDSEEEENSDRGTRRGKSRKKVMSQKNTRKRPRPVSSSGSEESNSVSEESSEESESESSEESSDDTKKKRMQKKSKKRVSSDESDSDDLPRKKKKKKNAQKTTPKRRRTRASQSSDEESEEEDQDSSDSDSEVDTTPKRRVKRNQKKVKVEAKGKKGKGKGKGKGKRKRVRDLSEDENDEEPDTPSKSKGRKKIRKLITDEKLGEETRKARRLEEERRQRLLERTRNSVVDELPSEDWKVDAVVLEADPETKKPIAEVNRHIVEYLKPHQVKGVQFMYDCTVESIKAAQKGETGGGCILAHCMGLGKTLQVVTLIHTLFNHKDLNFITALVVAPLNTVLNWQVEFEKWLSVDERMEVYVLQEVGANNWRRADMLKQWSRYGGIMIVGYDMYRNLSLCNNVRSKHQKKIFKETLVDPGPDFVVCDEGHILRNDTTAISKSLNAIKTRRRIVLTGTPLQNNLIEYHCMVSFVKPNLLGTRKEFMNTFGNPIQNGQCADSTPADVRIMKQRCHVLFKMLEGCVQRRDYAVLTPFLPKKHEYVVKVRLSESQRNLYKYYLNTFVYPDGDVTKRGVGLFSDYQALMRIWTHPWCLKLEAIRRQLRATYDDSDSLDDFVVHTDEEEEESASSSSEAGRDLNNDKEKKEKVKKEKPAPARRKVWDESGSSSDEVQEVRSSEDEVIPENRKSGHGRVTRNSMQTAYASRKPKQEGDDPEAGPSGVTANGEVVQENNFTTLEEAREAEKEWYDEFIKDEDEYNIELSGKIVLLLEILADAEAVEEKVLVFSQSLVSLDLIERALGGGEAGGDQENWCRGCDYFRMDGSTSPQLRQRWADIFNDEDNKTARLFLISTKAGGLGINLIAANRVIVFDASWNPSHDVQSIFRVYRFGQARPVYVYRFLAQGTMEEKIYDRQIAKLSISERVVDQHQIERHFTAADLSELYTFNPDILDEEKNKDEIPSLPLPKDAILADLINRQHPRWIVKYHEHDSLLVNQEGEELSEEEMKAAWLAYEAEKERANNPNAYYRALAQQKVSQLSEQYADIQQQPLLQQQGARPNSRQLDPALLEQIQRIQQQADRDRQRRFQAEMERIQRERIMSQQSGYPGQQMNRGVQLRPVNQVYIGSGAAPLQTEEMRQRLLQSMGATRPIHGAAPTGGATYQPMMGYITQQQQQTQRLLNPAAVRAAGVPQPGPAMQLNSMAPVVRPGSQ